MQNLKREKFELFNYLLLWLVKEGNSHCNSASSQSGSTIYGRDFVRATALTREGDFDICNLIGAD